MKQQSVNCVAHREVLKYITSFLLALEVQKKIKTT